MYLGEVNLGWLVILSYLVSFDLGFVTATTLFVLLRLRIDQSYISVPCCIKESKISLKVEKVCGKRMAEKDICSQTIAIPSGPLV